MRKKHLTITVLSCLITSSFAVQAQPALDKLIDLGRRKGGVVQTAGTSAGGDYYTIIGGGYDIWDRSDECTFVYHELVGDFDIKVQVIEFEGTGDTDGCCPKAGIMVRENLAEDSRRVMMAVGGRLNSNNHEYLWRTGLFMEGGVNVGGRNGGVHSTGGPVPPYPNAWIRLVREGAVFTGYHGSDGVNWTQLQQQDSTGWNNGAMPPRLYVGLAVSPHYVNDPGVNTATAIFTNYTETGSSVFRVDEVDSRGSTNKVFVTYSFPPGAGALEPSGYELTGLSPMTVTAVELGSNPREVVLTVNGLVEGNTNVLDVSEFVVSGGGGESLPSGVDGSFVHAKGYESRLIHVLHNVVQDGNEDIVTFWQAYKLGIPNPTLGRPAVESNTVFQDPLPNQGGCETDWGNVESNALFATRMVGVLVPPTSGTFTFATTADDASRIYLSPADDFNNRQQIAARACCIALRNFGDTSGWSTPQALVAGQRYALDYIYEEGCGGNWGAVAWNGDGVPLVNGKSPIEQNYFIPSRYAHNHVFFNLGPATIFHDPVDRTASEGSTATFSATPDGTPPYAYQWLTNGVPVPGANGPIFTTAALIPEWNGTRVSVCVSNAFGGACSAAATLTVLFDRTPPRLTAADHSVSGGVLVHFDEAMSASVEDVANYSIVGGTTPVTVTSAARLTSQSVVALSLSAPLEPATAYTLTVADVTDTALNPNTITPNPSMFTFSTYISCSNGIALFERWDGLTGTALAELTNNAASPFPDNPTLIATYTTMDTGADQAEHYGARLSAILVPAVSGSYQFQFITDDQGVCYLSPDSLPAHKQTILEEPGCCAWVAGGDIYLNAGQQYYLEVLFKEHEGGDYGRVQWKYPGTAGFLNIPSSNLWTCIRIDNVIGPEDLSVAVDREVSFCAEATGVGLNLLTRQWLDNAGVIPGANATCYTLPQRTTLADDGKTFQSAWTIPAIDPFVHVFESRIATLHVSTDDDPPVVLGVDCGNNRDEIVVHYDEEVEPGSATTAFAYNFGGFAVEVDATLEPDGKSVRVKTPFLYEDDTDYVLAIMDVQDRVGNSLTTNVTFHSCRKYDGFVVFEYYPNIAGSAISDVTGNTNYPNRPALRQFLPAMNSRLIFSDDSRENYGARMRGYFVPPVSGNWTFYIVSDDPSELHLNSAGDDYNGMSMIAQETACCGPIGKAGTVSAPIPLTAGNYYAMMFIYKEITGNDYGFVYAKLDTDPTPPESLVPIGGHMLAVSSAPIAGGTLAITTQPTDQIAAVVRGAVGGEDFNAGPGGFWVQNIGGPPMGPWTYNLPAGQWIAQGAVDTCGSLPTTTWASLLNSPVYVVPGGSLTLTLTHRYSFEGGLYDGGQIRVSLNGGPFTAVTTFTQNGYAAGALVGNHILEGLEGFNDTSPGYASGTFIDTIAQVGPFNPGDRIIIQLVGAWDECTSGTRPNWVVDRLQLAPAVEMTGALLPVTFTVAAEATVPPPGVASVSYQWQRDDGAGFVDISGVNGPAYALHPTAGNGPSYTLYPSLSDHGARFRCVVKSAGIGSEISNVATLIVGSGGVLTIRRSDGNVIVEWNTGVLQSAPAVTGPFSDVLGAMSPYSTPASATQLYFRVRQ